MQSKAKTVSQYLAALPADRREVIENVRSVILKNLPKGYEETMQYGMIGYVVPLRLYPPGYHCGKDIPLPFVSLGAQKNHMAVYMCSAYMDKADHAWFQKEYKASGKKMGKGCIRFKRVDEIPLELIGKLVARIPVKKFVATYEKTRR